MAFYPFIFSNTSPTGCFLAKSPCSGLPHTMGASWKQRSTLHICVPRPLIWHTVRFTYMNWVDPGYFPTWLPKGKNEEVGHLVEKFGNDTERGYIDCRPGSRVYQLEAEALERHTGLQFKLLLLITWRVKLLHLQSLTSSFLSEDADGITSQGC